MKWWEKEYLVLSAIQCNYGDDSYDNLKNHVIANSFNSEQLLHLTAKGHWAYFDEEKDGKKLDEYLVKTRKHSLREIIYFNIHCIPEELSVKHPDWIQYDKNGEPLYIYNTTAYICLNSPWRKHFIKEISNLCSHDIDGIFLDGPVIAQEGCYCEYCQKSFREWVTTVENVPVDKTHTLFDATPLEMMEYKVWVTANFLKEAYDIVNSLRDDVLIYINNGAYHADVIGSRVRSVVPFVDMLGAEGGFTWVDRDTYIWTVSAFSKILATQSGGKPFVIFTAGDYKPWSYYMHTAEETSLYYAQAAAHGANIYYAIHGDISHMNTPGGECVKKWNKYLLENSSIYKGTEQEAKIALLWSQPSANYYASTVETTDFTKAQDIEKNILKGDHRNSFYGFYEILSREHIQFDVLDEKSLTDGTLDKYELLIMPTVACMTKTEVLKVKEFVKNGGKLISTGDTACYDEWGRRTEPQLFEVQGYEKIESYEKRDYSGVGYQRSDRDTYITKNLSWKLIPSPFLALKVKPSEKAKVCAEYCAEMQGRYTELSKEWFPSVLTNSYGKGESIYFAGMVGEFYFDKANNDTHRMIADTIMHLSSPLIKTNAPSSVEMVLRKKDDAFILHLINATGEMVRPLQNIIPIHDVHIVLHTGSPLSEIESKTKCNPQNFVSTKDGCEFDLPIVEAYEALLIK